MNETKEEISLMTPFGNQVTHPYFVLTFFFRTLFMCYVLSQIGINFSHMKSLTVINSHIIPRRSNVDLLTNLFTINSLLSS